jgi:hypothetical protein
MTQRRGTDGVKAMQKELNTEDTKDTKKEEVRISDPETPIISGLCVICGEIPDEAPANRSVSGLSFTVRSGCCQCDGAPAKRVILGAKITAQVLLLTWAKAAHGRPR